MSAETQGSDADLPAAAVAGGRVWLRPALAWSLVVLALASALALDGKETFGRLALALALALGLDGPAAAAAEAGGIGFPVPEA